MLYIGLVIVAIAALGALGALHLWFWRAYYRPEECGVDEVHFATTVDGWRLALHRYRPELDDADNPFLGQPIVLCHGLGANRMSFDLGPEVSLARWLRRRGWDVWCVELRGVGHSRHPDDSIARHWNWTVSDYLDKDLPAAIEHICTATGAPAVHWIGHSLGGMLGYAYLQTRGAARVRSATAIGSPAFFEPTYALQSLVRLHRLMSWLPALRVSFLSSFLAPFYVAVKLKLVAINGATTDGQVVRRAMCHLVTDMAGGVLRTLSEWVENGTFVLRGADLQTGLANIRTPMLVIAGDADPVAPPGECRRVIETIGSDERRFQVFGRRFGATEDYGHGDLLFGRDVDAEVFPTIGEWLAERAADALPPPMPEAVLEDRTEPALDVEPEPGAGDVVDPDDQVVIEAPRHATIDGPFGLLNRYSPTRRRRWLAARARFRRQELRDHAARMAGVKPGDSRVSLRAARLRTRNVRRERGQELARVADALDLPVGNGHDSPESTDEPLTEAVPVAPAERDNDDETSPAVAARREPADATDERAPR